MFRRSSPALPDPVPEAFLALPGPVPGVSPSLSDRVPEANHVLPNTTSGASLALPGPVPGARPALADRVPEALQNLDKLAAALYRRERVRQRIIQIQRDFRDQKHPTLKSVTMTKNKVWSEYHEFNRCHGEVIILVPEEALNEQEEVYWVFESLFNEVAVPVEEMLLDIQKTSFKKLDPQEVRYEQFSSAPKPKPAATPKPVPTSASTHVNPMVFTTTPIKSDPRSSTSPHEVILVPGRYAPPKKSIEVDDSKMPLLSVVGLKPEPNPESSLIQLKTSEKHIATESICELVSDSRPILSSAQPSAVDSRPREVFNMLPIADIKSDFPATTDYLKNVTAKEESGPVLPAIPFIQVSPHHKVIDTDPRRVHSEEPKNHPDFELQQNCAQSLSLSAMAACRIRSGDSNRHRGTKSVAANEARSQKRVEIRLPIVSADLVFAEVPEDVANSANSERDEEATNSRQRASFCEVLPDSIPEQNPEAVPLDQTVALDPDINRFHPESGLNNPQDEADSSRVTRDSGSKVTKIPTKMIPRSRGAPVFPERNSQKRNDTNSNPVPRVQISVKNTLHVHLDIVPKTSISLVKTVAEKDPLMPPVSKATGKLDLFSTIGKSQPRKCGVPPARCQPRQLCQECAKLQNQTKEVTNQEINYNKDTDDCALQVGRPYAPPSRREQVTYKLTWINLIKPGGMCRIAHSETASCNPFPALYREAIGVPKKQSFDNPDRTDDLALTGGAERPTPRKIWHAVAVLQLLQEPRDTLQNQDKKPATQSRPNDTLSDEKVAQEWLINRELVATKMLNTSDPYLAEETLPVNERETERQLGEARTTVKILSRPWDPGSTSHTSSPIQNKPRNKTEDPELLLNQRFNGGNMFGLTEDLPPPLQHPLTTPLSNAAAVNLTDNYNGPQRVWPPTRWRKARLLRTDESRSTHRTISTCSKNPSEQKQKDRKEEELVK